MKKSLCSITQLVEEGVTPHYSFEINVFSDSFLAVVIFVYYTDRHPTGNYPILILALSDEKELCSITQLVEEGVTPQHSFEITIFSDLFLVFRNLRLSC
jgi:hypothetical protein